MVWPFFFYLTGYPLASMLGATAGGRTQNLGIQSQQDEYQSIIEH